MATSLAKRLLALTALALGMLSLTASPLLAQRDRPGPPPQQPIYELRFVNQYDFPVLLKFVGFQNAANYTAPIGPGESVRQNIYAGHRVACVWDMQGNVIMHEVVAVDRHGVIRLGPPHAGQAPPMDVVPAVGGSPAVAQPGDAAGVPAARPAERPAGGEPAVGQPPRGEGASGEAGAATPATEPAGRVPTGAAAGAGAAAGGGLQVEREPSPAPAEGFPPTGGANAGGGLTIEPEDEAAPAAGGRRP